MTDDLAQTRRSGERGVPQTAQAWPGRRSKELLEHGAIGRVPLAALELGQPLEDPPRRVASQGGSDVEGEHVREFVREVSVATGGRHIERHQDVFAIPRDGAGSQRSVERTARGKENQQRAK